MQEQENVLEWKDLRYVIKIKQNQTKTLLDGVTGRFVSGEVCVVMGPSGAGKTTLLNVLAGRYLKRTSKITGDIRVNGIKRNKRWKRCYGYVEQFDVLHQYLSPTEILSFAASFKRTESQGDALQLAQNIEQILHQLGIAHIQSRRISSGISGGEKKRVSIGQEIIGQPAFLFLDEPTSGLDAFNAFLLVKMLKQLAEQSRNCIVLTLHQPRIEILELVDKVLLMAEGKVVYFGLQTECQRYFELLGFPVPVRMNPADYFLDLITKDIRSPEQESQSIERIRMLLERWEVGAETFEFSPAIEFPSHSKQLPVFYEMWVLLKRETKDTIRNVPFQLFRLLQVSVFAVIIGLAFLQIGFTARDIQNRLGVLFFLTINVSFTTLNPYLHQFPTDRIRIIRERATDSYRGWTAYISKMLSAWPALLLVNFAYLSALYWMIGLQSNAGKFFIFILILLTLVVFAQSFALTVGAACESMDVANVIAPTLLIIFVIFAGSFLNPKSLPGYLIWLYWISPFHYAYKSLSINEFTGLQFECPMSVQGEMCFRNGEDVLHFYYLYIPSLWPSYLILAGMTLACIGCGMLILEFATSTRIRI